MDNVNEIVDENLRRQNSKRFDYHYRVNDLVLIKVKKPTKLQERAIGPFPITQIHVNGTVDVLRRPGVVECINIRRLMPYKQPTN